MDVTAILTLHEELTEHWHETEPQAGGDDFLSIVGRNHLENFSLWHEEDIARCDHLGSERIHAAKKKIDAHNQQRNDLIEEMDRRIAAALNPRVSGCPFNSETPGMMIDRLSILALKKYHMQEEVDRVDASREHRDSCRRKRDVIGQQIQDLSTALDELLSDIQAGRRSFRVYFQFKMYNDTELNPQLRRAG